ncbi:hypothetical protein GCM10009527_095970 [Actinomadura nitritigenes]|uniref:Uncharacterized protein n=1 Tax=Actinomadura nitritigenes TaxID=134602 RepID=A0ABS3R6V5_9ACTN|nr:hypothetical protein [Actinomadura nitritigenes]MBO2441860.1 hypothetical protein [Actinomadura nitritigenes]
MRERSEKRTRQQALELIRRLGVSFHPSSTTPHRGEHAGTPADGQLTVTGSFVVGDYR